MYLTQEKADLAKALASAQAELGPIAKNKTNPAYKSKYADLGAIIEAASPIVAKHGLAVVQAPTIEYRGEDDSYADVLITTILHTSGQYIQFPTPLRVAANANAQAYGSAVTYMKRYAYCAALNIATEDDDGEAAKNAAPEAPKTTSRPAPARVAGLPGMRDKARSALKAYVDEGKITKDHAGFLWADYDEADHARWLKMIESAATGEPTFIEAAK